MLVSSTTNWVEVGGIAQLLAAAATIILAGVTAVMAIRTHQEASATRDLVKETQRDRQLLWQPQIEIVKYRHVASSNDYELVVRNSGAAPALQVTMVARESHSMNWVNESHGDLRPGEATPSQAYPAGHGGPYSKPFEGEAAELRDAEFVAVAGVL